jgi:hypothetical protein
MMGSVMPKEIFFDEHETFRKRVGLMDRADDFLGLQIQPPYAAGIFDWRDLPKLEAFIRQDPTYHIVSIPRSGISVNRVVPTSRLYHLADGDADPSLMCITTRRFWSDWAKEFGMRSSAKSR